MRAGAFSSLDPSPCPYSPECVEGVFCELRLAAILGSLPTRCGIGPGIWRKARECPNLGTMGDAT